MMIAMIVIPRPSLSKARLSQTDHAQIDLLQCATTRTAPAFRARASQEQADPPVQQDQEHIFA